MIGVFFYLIYFLLLIFPLYFLNNRKYIHLSIMPLLFFPHFNVTCFLKLGITFSYFEIYLCFLVFFMFVSGIKFKVLLIKSDYIYILLLLISLVSIIVAQIRIFMIQDLDPSIVFPIPPFYRSLMSLNKMIFYPFLLIYIRNYYENKDVNINYYFIKYLAYSGVVPAIAAIFQISPINFKLFFNNPSFSMDLGWSSVERIVGLTNEASFFAFLIFFSLLGTYYAYKNSIISKCIRDCLYCLYILVVLLSISRTGMLIFVLFFLHKVFQGISFQRILWVSFVVIIGIGILSNITIGGFNIADRFTSSFNIYADLSTIERYGVTEALIRLAIDKSLYWGVGIYNYTFYIFDYLPVYLLDVIKYPSNFQIPSFNFIIQLFVELGFLFFILFFLSAFLLLRSIKNSILSDWYIYLFIFALSFQVLNFSLPFVILLYNFKKTKKYAV